MEQRPPPPDMFYNYNYPPYPAPPPPALPHMYSYSSRPHHPLRYDPYGRPPGYPGPVYPPDFPDIDEPRKRTLVLAPEYERNYGRPPGIPEPSQQENMPMLPHSQYQPLPRPSSAPRSPTSVESSTRVSPIPENEIDPTIGMTEKQKKTYMQNEKRKARNREAQRKAREKQKKTIEELNAQLVEVRRQNERLKMERDELQSQMNQMVSTYNFGMNFTG